MIDGPVKPIDPASGRDMKLLLGEPWITARPYIAHLDNGNLRAVWRGGRGQQVGIQFRGNHIVHVVLRFRPHARTFLGQFSGRCLLDDIRGLLRVLDLQDLLIDSRQTPETGLGAIFGQWPGDESEEQIAEALEQLS